MKKLDGRKKAPQLLPRQPSTSLTNANVRRTIEMFEQSGQSSHSGRATTLQYIIDYCEEQRIPYAISAAPGKGYYIQKLQLEYKSTGDPEITAAIQWLLYKSQEAARWGGPHRWRKPLLRYVGKMMRDYAKLQKLFILEELKKVLDKQPCQGNIGKIFDFYTENMREFQ